MRLATVALVLLLFAAVCRLDSTTDHRNGPDGEKAKAESALVVLAGEFRTVFANLLWIKADNYHHEFEANNGDWTKDKDLLGMNRLITRLDPHFEEAYASIAIMLASNGKYKETKAILEEGVANNPNSMMLHDEFGTLLARHMKDYKASLYHLKKAYCLTDDDFHKKRLRRLIKTVEKMAEPKSDGASSHPS